MATIKDIAREAGVSIGTVDRVPHDRGMVSPDKARIPDVMKELDYKPNHAARDLPSEKEIKTWLLIPDDKGSSFYLDIKRVP